jgi:hypothetical protein
MNKDHEVFFQTERELRLSAEEMYREVRQLLVRIAEALIPEVVDKKLKEDPRAIENMSDKELADLIVAEVKVKLTRLAELNLQARRFQEAQERLKGLEEEVAALRGKLEEERGIREALETRLALLKRAIPQPVLEEKPPSEPEVLPSFIREWQEESGESFERDKIALWVLGSTGVARRMDASALVAKEFGVSPGSGSVTRAFERLKKQGLLETIEVCFGDEIWHLYRLTEKGQDAFRILFSTEPAPSQATLLLNKHKTPEHVILILKAADILQAAGYQVDVLPPSLTLPDGSIYEPDIVAIGEKTIHLECEMGRVAIGERLEKWRKCYIAGNGEIHVAVPNAEALMVVRSDILFSLTSLKLRPFTLRIMDVSQATKEKLWQDVRTQE